MKDKAIQRVFGARWQGEGGFGRPSNVTEADWEDFFTSGDMEIAWRSRYGEQDWEGQRLAAKRLEPALRAIFFAYDIPPSKWNADSNPKYLDMLRAMQNLIIQDYSVGPEDQPEGYGVHEATPVSVIPQDVIDEIVRGARDAGHPDPEVVGENLGSFYYTYDPRTRRFRFAGLNLSPYEFGKWYNDTELRLGHGFYGMTPEQVVNEAKHKK